MLLRLSFLSCYLTLSASLAAAELPKVTQVELQPLTAQAKRVAATLSNSWGVPLPAAERKALEAAKDVGAIQAILDPYCLAGVTLRDRIVATQLPGLTLGSAKPELAEQGLCVFLVKVYNPVGLQGIELRASSPNALPLFSRSSNKADPKVILVGEVGKLPRLTMFNGQPLVRPLSGLEVEYRIVQIYCRDSGRKEGALRFNADIEGGKQRRCRRRAAPVSFRVGPCRAGTAARTP